jgi:hypothetical protein
MNKNELVKSHKQSDSASSTPLLLLVAALSGCAASAAALAAASEARQGPRGVFLLLGYSAFGFTAFGAAITVVLGRWRRLASPLGISWLGIPWITWIVSTVGLATAVVLITHALTYGSAPAS